MNMKDWLAQSWDKTFDKRWWVHTPHRLFWIIGIPILAISPIIIVIIITVLTEGPTT